MSNSRLNEIVNSLTEHQKKQISEQLYQRKTHIPQQYDIAIIGLGGKYPQSENHYVFWEKLQQTANLVEEIPKERWDQTNYYDAKLKKAYTPHKTCCKFGAFLKNYDHFDASFFDISANEVLHMDPQERLALETTWSCIEDAGYTPEELGANVGIFSGVTYNEFQKLIPGVSHSCMINNRISYFFNFQGIAVTTDAGCASSLSAIHLACQSLLLKECDSALVIGTNLILHPDHYTTLTSMLSSTMEPYSNPLGEDDGWIPSEGIVSILLKPLQQAVHDRDHIYAVIKSSHICQGGKTSWFTAFNPKQQAKLIRENFEKSGIPPETISYVEMAANGSSLGDAIEFEGLTAAFRHFTPKEQICPVGTVKANAGHAESASTLIQLTKLLLQFKSKKLLPLINLKEVNPNIRLEKSPFYIPKSIQDWNPPHMKLNGREYTLPRRATISSFAAGGNLGHLILEEYESDQPNHQSLGEYFIPLSSKTVDQLRQTVESYLRFFEVYQDYDWGWQTNYSLFNIMHTLCVGRVSFKQRVVFIVHNLTELTHKFRQYLSNEHDPDIITMDQGDQEPKTNEQKRIQVEQDMQSQSWLSLAKLWVAGEMISWESFFQSYPCHRVPLPTYCFQKTSFPVPKPGFLNVNLTREGLVNFGEIKGDLANINDGVSTVSKVDLTATTVKPQTRNSSGMLEIDNQVLKVFKEIFAKVFELPVERLDVHMPLERYGFDSVKVIEAATELETYFSKVPKFLFFECQTIQDVIDWFIHQYPEEVRVLTEAKESRNNPVRETEDKGQIGNQSQAGPSIKESCNLEPEDSIDDLAMAILSDRITAEKILQKL